MLPNRRILVIPDAWQSHIAKEGPLVFMLMYRVTIFHFNELLRGVEMKIKTDEMDMAIRSAGSPVCAEVRLGMTLRYIAGGQLWDIRSYLGVVTSEFYLSVWCVVYVLIEQFPIDLDYTETNA